MNLTDMIQQMCRGVLSQADIKAICKIRSLPAAAADSHTLLETLFVTDSGLAAALQTLERNEVAALHLLLAIDKPVDVSFFRRVYPKQEGYAYGSFTQRYQKVLAKVKERLVRSGVLVMTLGHSWTKKSQMERWQFAVPPSFAPHLPPLVESAGHFAAQATGIGAARWPGNNCRRCSAARPASKPRKKTGSRLPTASCVGAASRFAPSG